VWSKAPAMFGPVVFAAWDLLVLPGVRRRWSAIGVIGIATLLAAVPVILIAREARIIDEAEGARAGRLVSVIGVEGHYVESLVLAKPPSISYPIQTDGPSPIDLAIGGVALLGSIGLVARLQKDEPRRWRLALLAWAWIWFVPISQLVAPVHIFVADRFAYLWSAAGCVAVAWLIDRLRATARLAIGGALECVLGVATVRAEAAWTNSVELFTRGFDANPDDPQVCENLAIALTAVGETTEALAVLDRGLVQRPAHSHLLVQKARILDMMGHRAEALAVMKTAADTDAAGAMWSYAELLRTAGRSEEALAWAERAARRHPEIESYQRTEAAILLELGRAADAELVLRATLAIDPGLPIDHLLLATALIRLGRAAEAVPHLVIAERDRSLVDAVQQLRRAVDPR
jgi:tetratricopeptide (TPR) repeat protein